MVNAQEWLGKEYPLEKRNEITELNIINKDLTGSLNLNDFVNLDLLECWNNKLINLIITNCEKLTAVYCYNNQLTNLELTNVPLLITKWGIRSTNRNSSQR